jgi:intracellular sulfur oxidation DsrE/DsrF family protein
MLARIFSSRKISVLFSGAARGAFSQSYNAKVKAFNQKAVTFNACMKT